MTLIVNMLKNGHTPHLSILCIIRVLQVDIHLFIHIYHSTIPYKYLNLYKSHLQRGINTDQTHLYTILIANIQGLGQSVRESSNTLELDNIVMCNGTPTAVWTQAPPHQSGLSITHVALYTHSVGIMVNLKDFPTFPTKRNQLGDLQSVWKKTNVPGILVRCYVKQAIVKAAWRIAPVHQGTVTCSTLLDWRTPSPASVLLLARPTIPWHLKKKKSPVDSDFVPWKHEHHFKNFEI